MLVCPYIPVHKIIHSTGIGVSVEEQTLSMEKRDTIRSHEYHDQLATEADLEKIRNAVITYDKTETMRKYQWIGDAVGDILPVRLKGREYASTGTWDSIAMYRGVTNLLMDLADRPDFMHKTVKRLHDANWDSIKQMETLDLFDNDPYTIRETPIAVTPRIG